MWKKGEKCGFPVRILVAALITVIIFGLVPSRFPVQLVQPASASPDSYSDTNSFLTFSVEGATFVEKNQEVGNSYSNNWAYYFVTPSEGQVKIAAKTETVKDYGSGQIELYGTEFQKYSSTDSLDDNNASAGLPLYVSGSIAIDHAFNEAQISVNFLNNSAMYVWLYLFAKPTISTVAVNATTVTGQDAVRVYGQVSPKDYASGVYINYTREGQNGRFVSAESGVSTGSFADTFAAEGSASGAWTATALVNASYGNKLAWMVSSLDPSMGNMSELYNGLLIDSKSVSFTVTGQAQPSQTQEADYTVGDVYGTVQVQRAGSTSWIPATSNMMIFPGDTLSTGNSKGNMVSLKTRDGRHIFLGYKTVMKVSEPGQGPNVLDTLLELQGTVETDDLYSAYVQSLFVEFLTPHARVSEIGTQFEVLVDDTGTVVRTFSGTVQVTDVNSTFSVDVGENQTTTVPRGGYPYEPTLFDASTVDRWWTVLPSPTSTPAGIGLSNFPALIYSLVPYIVIVAVIIIIVVLARVALGSRSKSGERISRAQQ